MRFKALLKTAGREATMIDESETKHYENYKEDEWQFRLRDLLVFLTVLIALVALFNYYFFSPRMDRHRLKSKVEALGGMYYFMESNQLTFINFEDIVFTDQQLQSLIPSLERNPGIIANFRGTQLTDDGAELLRNLPQSREVRNSFTFDNTFVTDEMAKRINGWDSRSTQLNRSVGN